MWRAAAGFRQSRRPRSRRIRSVRERAPGRPPIADKPQRGKIRRRAAARRSVPAQAQRRTRGGAPPGSVARNGRFLRPPPPRQRRNRRIRVRRLPKPRTAPKKMRRDPGRRRAAYKAGHAQPGRAPLPIAGAPAEPERIRKRPDQVARRDRGARSAGAFRAAVPANPPRRPGPHFFPTPAARIVPRH